MTNRERLLTVIQGKIPDAVPVAPDFSNMIPAKLTGKPFWDLYLYNDPPIWEAYIDCAKFFDIDAVMDGYFPLTFATNTAENEWQPFIVFKNSERIVVQKSQTIGKKRYWQPTVDVYYVGDPPTMGLPPAKLNLPRIPQYYEPLEGVKSVDLGPEGLKRIKKLMGEQGLVGIFVTSSCALANEDDIYRYYDHPALHEKWARNRIEEAELRFHQIMQMEVKPDFLCVGGSGTLVFQTIDIFRQLAFPAVKRVIERAAAAGMPTHVHSCGPEAELVKIFAKETALTIIDPLEMPPMGDCDLAKIKLLYGDKIILKGNLHTTDVMLNGTVDEVIQTSKIAIDAAAENGKFILSTGDQCGRDTPFENLRAMIETARSYGKY